ncbi:hypothetical protein, partial [Clostridium perfringens]|uniref:hypothetical protein n=1 Tax=Clostridium perfringens TaxID=1502 RepID=UPI002ACC2AED
ASKERVSYSSGINVRESMIAGIMFIYKREGASPLSAKPLLLHSIVVYPGSSRSILIVTPR